MFGRRKVAALVAEFLATGALTMVVLSVQRSTLSLAYFIALAAGLVSVMLVFVFGNVSGAHANPAITLGLWAARKVGTLTAALYIVMQLLGAWAAYGLYSYFVGSTLRALSSDFTLRIMIAEAIGALVLSLGWAAVSFRNNFTNGTRAAVIGVSYAVGVMIAATAPVAKLGVGLGLINPAVALGVRAWEITNVADLGMYVAGPLAGAIVGVTLYGLLFAPAAAEAEAVIVEEVVVAEAVAAPAATIRKTTARKTTTKAASTRSKATTGRPVAGRPKKTTTASAAKRSTGSRSTRTRR